MKYVIIAIVGVIVLTIIMHFINRAYRIKYGYNLFGGGVIMLLVIGCGVGAYFLRDSAKTLAMGLGVVGAILLVILFIVNVKKCGFGAGFLAIFLQIVFSVPSLLLIFELFSRKGYSPTLNSMNHSRSNRRIEEERRRRMDEQRYRRMNGRDYY
ncbi:hypothetical protein EOM82_03340 [bacterium]|nr:hypothetical protein [bacterium]